MRQNNVTSYISAPIALNDNLSIVASTGAAGTFNLSGGISDGINGSKSIIATGTTTAGGTVVIAGVSNTYSGTTTIENGSLAVGGDILTGVAGPLGNATSAIAITTAISPAANVGLNFFATGTNVTNTISRPLDFSGSNTNASATGSAQLQYVVPGGNTDVLNVTSGVTIGTKRAANFTQAGQADRSILRD